MEAEIGRHLGTACVKAFDIAMFSTEKLVAGESRANPLSKSNVLLRVRRWVVDNLPRLQWTPLVSLDPDAQSE